MAEPVSKSVSGEEPSKRGSASAFQIVDAIIESVGRRGVHIFGIPCEHVTLVMLGVIFVVLPTAIMLAWMPFWEHVGGIQPLKQINTIIAPEMASASSPRERRFMVGLASMIELLLLANFLSLLSRRVRRHALMVWTCFDRGKILLYLAASGISFGTLWYVIFCDWRPLAFVYSHGGAGTRAGSLFLYVAVLVPLVTVLFGHLLKIVMLGLIRGAERPVRVRLRRRRTLCDLSRSTSSSTHLSE